jgi:hypothetical protein
VLDEQRCLKGTLGGCQARLPLIEPEGLKRDEGFRNLKWALNVSLANAKPTHLVIATHNRICLGRLHDCIVLLEDEHRGFDTLE